MKILLSLPDGLVKKMDAFCEDYEYERSEFIRMLIRRELDPTVDVPPIPQKQMEAPKKNLENKNSVEPVVVDYTKVIETDKAGNSLDYLWDDWNLMPVYKQGTDDQFCVTWHKKGEKRRVYPIKKFRSDGSLECEGNYCKECIDGFLKAEGHLE